MAAANAGPFHGVSSAVLVVCCERRRDVTCYTAVSWRRRLVGWRAAEAVALAKIRGPRCVL
eukprot:scaffold8473_cov141-Isochrysis_galbana.AAC.3